MESGGHWIERPFPDKTHNVISVELYWPYMHYFECSATSVCKAEAASLSTCITAIK